DPIGALDEPARAQGQHGHNGNDHAEAKPQAGGAGHAAEVKPPDRIGGLSTVRCGSGVDLEAGGCLAAASRESTKPIGTRSSPSSMRPEPDATIPAIWRARCFPPAWRTGPP